MKLVVALPLALGLLGSAAAARLETRTDGPSNRLLERMVDSPEYTYNVTQCVGYEVTGTTETESGFLADLSLQKNCSAFGTDIADLVLNVTYDTKERLHVHIYDKAEQQWQVPEWLVPRPSAPVDSSLTTTSDLAFNYTSNPFEFWVTRRSSGDVIFDTRTSSLPAPLVDVIPANDLGEAGFVDSLDYPNNTAMPAFPFIFENQYIQIASALPTNANIYGLGDAVASSGFRRNNTATVQSGWAADRGDAADSNIYGNFPFYLEHRITGSSSTSHGVFLMSSAGMDIILREGVIEYRLVGGTLDLTFFSGPSPTEVVQQYGDITGHSQLPPLFALGFNLCRWGYQNISQTREVVTRMRESNIPLEVMWNDIDYMSAYRNFVSSPNRFEPSEYTAFVKELNDNGQHYTMIVDAAINLELNATDRYDAYRSGHDLDVYMKNPDGSEYIGQVWPGATAFPDWFAGNTQDWWTEALTNFSKIVPFSGIWLDMNEVSSFCLGSCFTGPDDPNLGNTSTPFLLPGTPGNPVTSFPEGYNASISGYSGNITVNGTITFGQSPPAAAARTRRDMLRRSLGAGGKIDYVGQSQLSEHDISFPPYMLHNAQDELNLGTHAVSPNATHANGAVELDVHNLWGYMEEKATHAAFTSIYPGKRPFLISRSTFTGSGRYTGAWGGDNSATWEEAKRSIQVILNFQMYHISLIGVDSCGFNGNTDEELCNRWMQLGAFSPFFRNHNVLGAISQEPYIWDSVAEASRIAIAARYELLPFWYTLFAKSYFSGTPVVNALFFHYPTDASLLAVSAQYLVGDAILVTPVLEPNVTSVSGLFPAGATTIWRDWWSHEVLDTSKISEGSSAANVTLPAPLGHIPIHIRGGSIILLYAEAKYTTIETKATGFALLVSLSHNGTATGTGYQDDGASYPVQTDGDWFDFSVSDSTFTGSAGSGGHTVEEHLKRVTILGVSPKPEKVECNGNDVANFTYDAALDRLVVPMDEDLNKGFKLTWA